MEGVSEVGKSGPKQLKSQCPTFANFTRTHRGQPIVYTLLDSCHNLLAEGRVHKEACSFAQLH